MNDKPTILAFAGSLREDSYNKKLIKIAIKGAESVGADVIYIDLRDYRMPIFDGDIEAREGLPQNAIRLKELMWKCDGFLISSPEYNSSISAATKNCIDWASRRATPDEANLSCFQNKVAALMSASPGQLGGMRGLVHLRSILENINTIVLPGQKCIPAAHDAFDAQGNLKVYDQQQAVEALGKTLALTISKLNADQ